MIKCLVCDHNDAGHRYACDDCILKTQRQLREIGSYWLLLEFPALHEPARGSTGRMSPGYGSRSPARDDVITVLDIRSSGDVYGPDDIDDPLIAIPTAIQHMASWIVQATGLPGGGYGYLLGSVQHVAMTKSIERLATEVGTLHRQLRALTHDQPPPALTACMVVGCEGVCYPEQRRDQPGRPAGARCDTCGRTYIGRDLVRLGAQEAS